MNTFSDYTFYTDVFLGQLSEADYKVSVRDAHREILSQTNGRARHAPSTMQEAVKLCECALVDAIHGYKQGASILPRGMASVSNDGYSVSVGQAGATELLRSKAKELHEICASYLQWPENLMSRWL